MNIKEKAIKLNEIKLKIEELDREYKKILNTPCEISCGSCKFLKGDRCELNQQLIPEHILKQGCECYQESDDFIPF